MVETAAGLAALEEIAAVPGLDMLFVGPFDLSQRLGTTVDDLLADSAPTPPSPACSPPPGGRRARRRVRRRAGARRFLAGSASPG